MRNYYPLDKTKPPKVLKIPLQDLVNDFGVNFLSQLHLIDIVDQNGRAIAEFVRNHPDTTAFIIKEARKAVDKKEKRRRR